MNAFQCLAFSPHAPLRYKFKISSHKTFSDHLIKVDTPSWASLVAQMVKNLSDPWAGKIPWRRPWQPTPVFFFFNFILFLNFT